MDGSGLTAGSPQGRLVRKNALRADAPGEPEMADNRAARAACLLRRRGGRNGRRRLMMHVMMVVVMLIVMMMVVMVMMVMLHRSGGSRRRSGLLGEGVTGEAEGERGGGGEGLDHGKVFLR